MHKKTSLLALVISLLLLSACGSSQAPSQPSLITSKPVASLEKLEARYTKNVSDPKHIRTFAQGLYHDQQYKRAGEIIAPLAIADEPETQDLYLFAQTFLQAKKTKYAETWLKKTLEQTPTHINARINLAKLYEDQENYTAAEPLYKEFLDQEEINQNNSNNRLTIINAYTYNLVSQKRHDDAAIHLAAAKELYPNDREIERNSRIVRALMQSHGHGAPKPRGKPPTKI